MAHCRRWLSQDSKAHSRDGCLKRNPTKVTARPRRHLLSKLLARATLPQLLGARPDPYSVLSMCTPINQCAYAALCTSPSAACVLLSSPPAGTRSSVFPAFKTGCALEPPSSARVSEGEECSSEPAMGTAALPSAAGVGAACCSPAPPLKCKRLEYVLPVVKPVAASDR